MPSVSLETLRWQRRLVVAFGDAPDELAELERVVRERACALRERDTDVHHVRSGGAMPLTDGSAPLDGSARDALAAVHRGEGFELVLIGKDGGVKRRAGRADALPDFLDAIDAMPMRRAERARDGGGCD